jgi:hypothetical protein
MRECVVSDEGLKEAGDDSGEKLTIDELEKLFMMLA